MIILERDITKINKDALNGSQVTTGASNELSNSIEDLQKQLDELLSSNKDVIDTKSKVRIQDLKKDQKFYGTITTTVKDKETGKKVRTQITSIFKVIDNKANSDRLMVQDTQDDKIYNTSRRGTKFRSMSESTKDAIKRKQIEQEIEQKKKEEKIMKELGIQFSSSDTPSRLRRTIEAGIKNIWLCGPAGSGNNCRLYE